MGSGGGPYANTPGRFTNHQPSLARVAPMVSGRGGNYANFTPLQMKPLCWESEDLVQERIATEEGEEPAGWQEGGAHRSRKQAPELRTKRQARRKSLCALSPHHFLGLGHRQAAPCETVRSRTLGRKQERDPIPFSCRLSTKLLLFSEVKSDLCLERRGDASASLQICLVLFILTLGYNGNRIS